MSKVLISESHIEVRNLLVRMVGELDHQPLLSSTTFAAEDLADVDLLIVEPADPKGALLAQTMRAADPELPILCVSVLDPSELGIEYGAFLPKPFTIEQLGSAIKRTLEQSASGQTSV